MDDYLEVTAIRCSDCDEPTYHFPIDGESITYSPDAGFTVHLTEDEMTDIFYLLQLFESQYNSKTDGDLTEYLTSRLRSYNSMN